MSSHFPTGMITQTNVSDTYRYAFSSGDDGYMYIDNVNLSTDEVTRLQFSKNGALDLLTINDGDLNYIGHFISNADLARGFQSAVQVPANSYADREVSHGLDGTPVSAVATLKVNTTNSENMANVQIQINEITSSAIKVRIHNNTNNAATVNFYWAAFL